ncbi:MAG: hypothetical protein JJD92_02635 [Frankiaceae bacterium]|nr:hypothetical protein [Frankiaceae bacterium]
MRRLPSLLRCAATLAATVIIAAGLSTATATAAHAEGSSTAALSGVYAGGLRLDKARAFGSWRGQAVTVTGDFLSGDSWAGVEAPDWWTGAWSGSGTRMVIGVPILPGPQGSTTLAAGATGAYDAHFRTLASRLIAAGMSDAVLRLGWEQNGTWYPWSSYGHETEFIGYWRHIVTAMRSVSGAKFAFAFNPTLGPGQWGSHPEQAWPGDSYVDTISLDVYDCMWGNSTATPAQRWTAVQEGTYALDWWAAFGAAHGNKPLSFPEWGLVDRADQNGGGGGDNPLFITNFLNWVRSHHVLYETYFEVDAQDGNHLLEGSTFPKAAAAYRQAMTAPAAAATPVAAAVTAPAADATTPIATVVATAVAPVAPLVTVAAPVAVATTAATSRTTVSASSRVVKRLRWRGVPRTRR